MASSSIIPVKLQKKNKRLKKYNDFYFRIVGSLIVAELFVTLGEKIPFLEAILMPSYYIAIGFSFFTAFLVFTFVNKVSTYLDLKYDWANKPVDRILLQLSLGILLPALISFFLVYLYFWYFNENIFDSTYPDYEFKLTVIFLILLNLYYYAFYLYQNWQVAEKKLKTILDSKSKEEDKKPSDEKEENGNSGNKEMYIVNTAAKSIPVKIEDIHYVFIKNGCPFIWLKGQETTQEAYPITSTLKEMEELLNPQQFIRINRQMIVSFTTCLSYRPGYHKTLELTLDPPLIDEEDKKLGFVAEERVPKFKKWLNR